MDDKKTIQNTIKEQKENCEKTIKCSARIYESL